VVESNAQRVFQLLQMVLVELEVGKLCWGLFVDPEARIATLGFFVYPEARISTLGFVCLSKGKDSYSGIFLFFSSNVSVASSSLGMLRVVATSVLSV